MTDCGKTCNVASLTKTRSEFLALILQGNRCEKQMSCSQISSLAYAHFALAI